MLARLSVSTHERMLPLVRALGREFAAAVGLSEPEGKRLVGAVDEVVRFVRERAYPGDPTGTIEVTLEPAERGIQVAVHDWGRPLTSAEGPPELAELATTVEDLRLINLGKEGKRLSFVWPTPHAVEVTTGATDAVLPSAATGDANEIAVATPGPRMPRRSPSCCTRTTRSRTSI